jgi:hypothetical protein
LVVVIIESWRRTINASIFKTMRKDIFNTNFNHQNFIDYLSLVWEDGNFDSESLKTPVELGIQKGLQKYEQNERKVNLFVYLTYFAKEEVKKFKGYI